MGQVAGQVDPTLLPPSWRGRRGRQSPATKSAVFVSTKTLIGHYKLGTHIVDVVDTNSLTLIRSQILNIEYRMVFLFTALDESIVSLQGTSLSNKAYPSFPEMQKHLCQPRSGQSREGKLI